MFEKEAEDYADKYVTEGVDELRRKVIKGHWQDGATFGYNKGRKEMVNVIKILITTLNTTTWREDSESPSRSGRETFYNCPDCSCKDCYRVACQYNMSETFKQLYQDFPEVYNLQIYK